MVAEMHVGTVGRVASGPGFVWKRASLSDSDLAAPSGRKKLAPVWVIGPDATQIL